MADFTSDVGTGLLDSAVHAAESYALQSTADNSDLHPLLQAIAGPQTGAPSPATAGTKLARPANNPPADQAGTFFQRNRTLILVCAAGALLVLLGVVHVKGVSLPAAK